MQVWHLITVLMLPLSSMFLHVFSHKCPPGFSWIINNGYVKFYFFVCTYLDCLLHVLKTDQKHCALINV